MFDARLSGGGFCNEKRIGNTKLYAHSVAWLSIEVGVVNLHRKADKDRDLPVCSETAPALLHNKSMLFSIVLNKPNNASNCFIREFSRLWESINYEDSPIASIYVEANASQILITIMTQESLQSKLYHMDLKAIYFDNE